jgi:hypothetical protein
LSYRKETVVPSEGAPAGAQAEPAVFDVREVSEVSDDAGGKSSRRGQ